MAALGLRAFVISFATEAERAAIEESEADGGPDPWWPPDDPAGQRRRDRRGRAERAWASALERALLTRPVATAVGTRLARRVPFALEVLRGRTHEPDFLLADQWEGRFVAIEVEVDAGEEGALPTSTAALEALAREFADRHPGRGQAALYRLYHAQKPPPRVGIPRELFPTLPGRGRKPRRS